MRELVAASFSFVIAAILILVTKPSYGPNLMLDATADGTDLHACFFSGAPTVSVYDSEFVQGWSRDRANDSNTKDAIIFRQVMVVVVL
jgi:hypothetical protein